MLSEVASAKAFGSLISVSFALENHFLNNSIGFSSPQSTYPIQVNFCHF